MRTPARTPYTKTQAILFALIACMTLVGLIYNYKLMFLIYCFVTPAFYSLIVGHKIIATLAGILFHDQESVSDEELNALDEQTLPIYTLLIPVYKEAEVLPVMVKALQHLDYPKDKLDIQLLLEEDDTETQAMAKQLNLPSYIRSIVVPQGIPKTKPRACNYGLEQAKGEFLVIYDAEDIPEPNQLKKSIIVFRRSDEKVGCLQAKLNFFNGNHNPLTRWFTLEYSTWFDLFLPGLHAINCPIPLGGTSNHFKVDVLKEHSGWDPFNVTEDCDLGIELACTGVETKVLDSTTWEECPHHLSPWVKQRSRWVKGYWQTFMVHSRNPLKLAWKMGFIRFFQMLILTAGHVFSMLMNPISTVIVISWCFLRWQLFYPESPWTLLFFLITVLLVVLNLFFIIIHFLAGIHRKLPSSFLYALTLPIYWTLISIGAWKGFLQFFYSPHYWEKTPHGNSDIAKNLPAAITPEPRNVPIKTKQKNPFDVSLHTSNKKHGLRTLTILLLTVLLSIAFVLYLPTKFHYIEQIRKAKITFNSPFAEEIKSLNQQSWIEKNKLKIAIDLEDNKNIKNYVYRFIVNVKVLDDEWYQYTTSDYKITKNGIELTLPLHDKTRWTPKDSKRPWGEYCLASINEIGIQLYTEKTNKIKKLHIKKIVGIPSKTDPPALTLLSTPKKGHLYKVSEFDFNINKTYTNPFDPKKIDLSLTIITPSEKKEQLFAYYTQDYELLSKLGEKERIVPVGAPHWRARYTPREPGIYTWQIKGHDYKKNLFKSSVQQLIVENSNAKGFVQVDKTNPRYFSFSNGEFYYPITLNIRSPHDNVLLQDQDFKQPKNNEGVSAMLSFIKKMKKSKIDMGRIWMAPWFGSIEWNKKEKGYHGLGYYNLQNAWKLDQLFKKAEKEGVLLELALNHHGPFHRSDYYDSQWKDNPYNVKNGGVIVSPHHILTVPKAIDFMKQRFRYIAARYGAYPSLFAWVLWIEVNTIGRRNAMAYWHKQLAPYLYNVDLGRHLITTEFSSAKGEPIIWRQPHIDYTQVAAYNFGEGLLTVFKQRASALKSYKKPAILEEYGGQPNGGYMTPIAFEIHNGLWMNFMLPLSGAPYAWWWNFIFDKKLTRFYTVFADFINGEDLRHEQWQFTSPLVSGSTKLKALARQSTTKGYAWIFNYKQNNLRYYGRYKQRLKSYDKKLKNLLPKETNILTDANPKLFPVEKNKKLIIKDIEPGTYTIEFWNTWDIKQQPKKITITTTTEILTIPLPDLEQDIAIKFYKETTSRKVRQDGND